MNTLFAQKQMNFSVRIEPRNLGNLGFVSVPTHWISDDPDADYKQRCEEIVLDVKRHVGNVGSVYVSSDTCDICPYCGAVIEHDDLLPSCCRALQDDARYNAYMTERLNKEIAYLENRLQKAREYLEYVIPETGKATE